MGSVTAAVNLVVCLWSQEAAAPEAVIGGCCLFSGRSLSDHGVAAPYVVMDGGISLESHEWQLLLGSHGWWLLVGWLLLEWSGGGCSSGGFWVASSPWEVAGGGCLLVSCSSGCSWVMAAPGVGGHDVVSPHVATGGGYFSGNCGWWLLTWLLAWLLMWSQSLGLLHKAQLLCT